MAKVLAKSPSDQSNAPSGNSDCPWMMVAVMEPVSMNAKVAAMDLGGRRLDLDMGNGLPYL
jgi:hypothetical protein